MFAVCRVYVSVFSGKIVSGINVVVRTIFGCLGQPDNHYYEPCGPPEHLIFSRTLPINIMKWNEKLLTLLNPHIYTNLNPYSTGIDLDL